MRALLARIFSFALGIPAMASQTNVKEYKHDISSSSDNVVFATKVYIPVLAKATNSPIGQA